MSIVVPYLGQSIVTWGYGPLVIVLEPKPPVGKRRRPRRVRIEKPTRIPTDKKKLAYYLQCLKFLDLLDYVTDIEKLASLTLEELREIFREQSAETVLIFLKILKRQDKAKYEEAKKLAETLKVKEVELKEELEELEIKKKSLKEELEIKEKLKKTQEGSEND